MHARTPRAFSLLVMAGMADTLLKVMPPSNLMLAHSGEGLIEVVALFWAWAGVAVVGIGCAFASFTKHRHTRFALASAAISMLVGFIFLFALVRRLAQEDSLSQKVPIVTVLISSIPLLSGGFALMRGVRPKTCPQCSAKLSARWQMGFPSSETCNRCGAQLRPSHAQQAVLALGLLFGALFCAKGDPYMGSLLERLCLASLGLLCAFGLAPGPTLQRASDEA